MSHDSSDYEYYRSVCVAQRTSSCYSFERRTVLALEARQDEILIGELWAASTKTTAAALLDGSLG